MRAPRVGLRVKWAAALLAGALVPLAIITAWMLRIQRRGLEVAEKEIEVAAVDEASHEIAQKFDGVVDAARGVARILTDGRIADDDVRLALAREALARSGDVDTVAIYGPDGAFLDALQQEGAPPLDADARAKLSAADLELGGTEAGVWRFHRASNAPFSATWVGAMRAGSETRGFVAGRAPAAELSKRVGDLARVRFGAPESMFVVDEQLTIVAGEGRGDVAVGAPLAGKDIFATVPLTAPMMRSPFGLTTEFASASGVPMVGTVRTLPELGLAVVARRPTEEAFLAYVEARRTLAWAAGLVVAFALTLGIALAERTTRPVARLVELVRAYGKRDFAKKSDVRTGDELEELGTSLGEMATNLASSEKEIARRAKVEAGLSRYLPRELAEAVASGDAELSLAGERRAISVVFADVASFTGFAERAEPEKVVAFLNELFGLLSEIVFRHQGMVDKFVGDCVMALFGATDGEPDHAARAVAAAEDMQRFVEAEGAAWKKKYGFDVKLGIGVASGEALVGNLGGETRMEYTAIGDVVNVASRLETLARPGQVLVTQAVSKAAGGSFEFVSLGEHTVRGKEKAVEILELASG